jgi:TatD DNase family protein
VDLYKNPELIVKECENKNIITIGVTNLPSHFEIGFPHVKNCKNVRLALGMHPLYIKCHENEFPVFLKNIDKTSYIGEVGLDFSKEGYSTKSMQLISFEKILNLIAAKKKILSIHSRRAEKEVLQLLIKYKIKNAIFHWYSGPIALINDIVDNGYYFSINPEMINSENGKKIIAKIPLDKILTESDGPFILIENKEIKPQHVSLVIDYLASTNLRSKDYIEKTIYENFRILISKIK